MVGAVIVAAGKGERMGGIDKAFVDLRGVPMAAYSLRAFDVCPDVTEMVLVVRAESVGRGQDLVRGCRLAKPVRVVAGGETRQDSVLAGLSALSRDVDFVAVHDAARPLVTPELISLCVASAREYGSGVAARRIYDSVKECAKADGVVTGAPDRSRLWAAQTPQVFVKARLKGALARAANEGAVVTDEASALGRAGAKVRLVEWRRPNFKVTYMEDVDAAAALLDRPPGDGRDDGRD